jgi:hypothetical protein
MIMLIYKNGEIDIIILYMMELEVPNSQVHPRRAHVGLVAWSGLLWSGCGRRV